jgi:hypothetical protein
MLTLLISHILIAYLVLTKNGISFKTDVNKCVPDFGTPLIINLGPFLNQNNGEKIII